MNTGPSLPPLDELAKKMADAVPRNLKALGEDLERNFKGMLQAGFERMELVTREEFDLQAAVLERTRDKLDRLETRLAELEAQLSK
jgi:BMFP domain-containing protein YqiC